MTSDRRIEANRRNSKLSTGPRSASGKARSNKNALQHGLAAQLTYERPLKAEVESLARSIAGPSASLSLLERARTAAVTELELLKIRFMRAAYLNWMAAQPSTFAPRKWRFSWKSSQQLPGAPTLMEQYKKALEIRHPKIPTGSELELRTFERAATKLEKFDRYEHRALIQRNRAFRALHMLEANS